MALAFSVVDEWLKKDKGPLRSGSGVGDWTDGATSLAPDVAQTEPG
jgi:hypothetical protein